MQEEVYYVFPNKASFSHQKVPFVTIGLFLKLAFEDFSPKVCLHNGSEISVTNSTLQMFSFDHKLS